MPERQVLTLQRVPPASRFQRLAAAVRGIVLGPWNPKDKEIAKYFGRGATLSGVSVNEYSALTYSAVWSAVTMIADDIASLPLMLYKRLPNGGKDRFESHSLYRLLHDAPNPEMDTMVWRRVMQTHVLLWQNAYAEIERDQAGRPLAIWPLIPERVRLVRDRGQIVYLVRNGDDGGSREVRIPAEDMIHLVGHSLDGTMGSSLVTQARESLALGLAAEKFGAAFFGNGAAVGGVISFKGPRPTEMSDKNYQEQLQLRHQGVERAHKLLALYNDATYTSNFVEPNKGQFNETRIFQIREVARWFKMPPHKLGDLADATYSNVEQMDAAYMSSCIRPWLVLWQQQLSRKLIARLERSQQFIEHDTHGFLSVDAAGRAALYQSEFNVGSLTPNEIRGYENRDPLTGGDRSFVPLNMIPMDRVDEWIDAQIKEKKPPPPPEPQPAPEPAPPTDEQLAVVSETVRTVVIAHVQTETEKRVAIELIAVARQAEIDSLTTQCDALGVGIREKETAIAELQQRHEQALRDTTDAGQQRAAVIAKDRDEARGRCAELQNQLAELTSIREALGQVKAERDHADAARQQAEARAEQEAVERAKLARRLDELADAVRGVLVDKVQGILQREIDRARKAQTTPDKLRTWIDSFYPLHEEFCRAALAPAMAAWAACAELPDPEAALARWIARHLDESRQQLQLVTQEADPDAYAAALERVLHRWETERAARTVTRWIKEQAA